MKKLMLFLMALTLLSCSAEKTNPAGKASGQEPGGRAGVSKPAAPVAATGAGSIEIKPPEADRHTRLLVVATGIQPDVSKIEWLVNGAPSGNTGYTFDAVNDARGDTIQARVMIAGKELLSNKVVVGDTPPEFTRIKIMPEVFKPGDRLYVEAAAKDLDGDPVTISYEWTKNGTAAGTTDTLASPVTRGDRISVKITPYDGIAYGIPVTLTREIGNLPPMIDSDGKYTVQGGVFSCPMHATDPDGDTLAWSLKTAPTGMTIDPSTGVISWKVPPDFTGKTSFTVCASDGHGGQSTETFNFENK